MKHILIVDDDIHIGNALQLSLQNEGYRVSRAYSGTEAQLLLTRYRPDLILLDLMLPGLSGEELLPQLQGIPVIVLSAMADTHNKVSLLLGGATDYVTKPFHTQELLARIAVQLRTVPSPAGHLEYGALRLDPESHCAFLSESAIRLTPTETTLLKLLLENPCQVLTKSQLLEHLALENPDGTESSLKIHISNLRKKLREPAGTDYIESVWGIGYKLASL